MGDVLLAAVRAVVADSVGTVRAAAAKALGDCVLADALLFVHSDISVGNLRAEVPGTLACLSAACKDSKLLVS